MEAQPEPPDAEVVSYYGSGKAKDTDIIRKVLEKYEAIEKSRQRDKPADDPGATPMQAKSVAAKKAAAKAIAKASAPLPSIDAPFAEASKAAKAEDDQIMALMALMLLED